MLILSWQPILWMTIWVHVFEKASPSQSSPSRSALFLSPHSKSVSHLSFSHLKASCSSESKSDQSTTGKVSKKKLYPFHEARRIARGHGFSSVEEFLAYDCPGVYQVPKNAPNLYHSDWTSWEDFLGLTLDFEMARSLIKSLGWKSTEEYLRHMESQPSGKKVGFEDENHWVYRLPYRPDLYYQELWVSWDHFLGLL